MKFQIYQLSNEGKKEEKTISRQSHSFRGRYRLDANDLNLAQ
jgi:hypothetical protein